MTTKREKKRIERHARDWAGFANDTAGRRVLYEILAMCGMYRQPMTGNSQTFFNLGEQNVGLRIISELDAIDPRIYPRMLLEHAEDAVNNTDRHDVVETEEDGDEDG